MKRIQCKLLAVIAAICITVGCFVVPHSSLDLQHEVSAKTLAEIEAEKKEKQKLQAEKQKELDSLSKDIEDQEAYQAVLQEKIDLINEELLLIDTQLQGLNADIATKESDIAVLEGQIAAQQDSIDEGLENFKARIRTLYVHGNDSLLSALVGATDFYDVLAKIDLINRIAEHDDEMLDTLNTQLNTLSETKTDLDSRVQALNLKKTETESIRGEYSTKMNELDAAMQETTAVKLELERQKNDAESYIAEYQEQIDSLDKETQAIIDAAKKEEEKNQQTGNPNPIITPDPGYNGTLAWPVPGFYYISSRFGPRWGRTHSGIDIAGGGIHHANITAAASGTVTKVVVGCPHDYAGFCYCGGGYGNYVTVNHGNGLVTLYAHMSSVSVSVGDTVSTGSVLGHVGSTGNSTGYHLHFSVIVNGTFVNPENYLY
ncbi:MAG: peptidoglycan DD-metalloendopeptidase family protein [Oscillospiraceae bacterium]|nr:peptidoglycan DD-metalloendopeptidase family protein [Oscillospiraceae bacterium]